MAWYDSRTPRFRIPGCLVQMLKRSANELAQQCVNGDGEECAPFKEWSAGAAGAARVPRVRTCHSSGLETNIVGAGAGSSRRTKSNSKRRPGTAPAKIRRCGGGRGRVGGENRAAEAGKQQSFVNMMSTDDECCAHQYSYSGSNHPTPTGRPSSQRIRAQTAERSRAHSNSTSSNCGGCFRVGDAKKHPRRGAQSADRSRTRSSGAYRCSHPLTVTLPPHYRIFTGSDVDTEKTNATDVETANNIGGQSQRNGESKESKEGAVTVVDQHRLQTKEEDAGNEGNRSDNAAAINIDSCRLRQRGDEGEEALLAMRKSHRPPISADHSVRRSRGSDIVDSSDGQQAKKDDTAAAAAAVEKETATETAKLTRDASAHLGDEVAEKEIRSAAAMDGVAVQVYLSVTSSKRQIEDKQLARPSQLLPPAFNAIDFLCCATRLTLDDGTHPPRSCAPSKKPQPKNADQ